MSQSAVAPEQVCL